MALDAEELAGDMDDRMQERVPLDGEARAGRQAMCLAFAEAIVGHIKSRAAVSGALTPGLVLDSVSGPVTGTVTLLAGSID